MRFREQKYLNEKLKNVKSLNENNAENQIDFNDVKTQKAYNESDLIWENIAKD